MSFTVVLDGPAARARASAMVLKAPFGWVMRLKEAKRTLDQNAKLWAMLTEVSLQKEHAGMRHEPETWKALFMHELKMECKFVPDLNFSGAIPLGYRSSKLTKKQMAALIEIMLKWGAENGVKFKDEEENNEQSNV